MPVSTEHLLRDENPYASPRALGGAIPHELPVEIWSHGDRVIAHRQAVWPHICVKSGLPAATPVQAFTPRSHWPFAIFFLVFMVMPLPFTAAVFLRPRAYRLGWTMGVMVACMTLFGIVVVLLLRRQSKITIFVSDSAARQRTIGTVLSTLFSFAMLAAFASSFLMPLQVRFAPMWVGALCSVAMAIFARRWQMLLYPVKLGKQYVVLRGAGKVFLSQLPAWPYGPA